MPDPFGSFSWICSHTPLPQCNLFFSQLWNDDQPYLTTLFPSSSTFFAQYNVTSSSSTEDLTVAAARLAAGTGIGADCQIAHVGQRGSHGDIALIVISALSLLLAMILTATASRRKAAVGRVEIRMFLVLFGIHSALQIITMTSLLEQASRGLAIVSSIHVAIIVTMFWVLLGNALVATQIVEDGTFAAIVPLTVFAILFFIPTLYISLDTSLHWTSEFNMSSSDVDPLKAIALFILTLIWPAVAAVLYLVLMLYIVLGVLKERKPALLYIASFIFFAGGQVVFFLASQPLCNASNGKINSAFIAALLEMISVGTLYLAWKAITEDDWGEDEYAYY